MPSLFVCVARRHGQCCILIHLLWADSNQVCFLQFFDVFFASKNPLFTLCVIKHVSLSWATAFIRANDLLRWKASYFIWKNRLPSLTIWPGLFYSSEHYENTPIQIYWKFHHQNLKVFSDKNSDILHISAQNIACWYSLEPPRRGGSNEYHNLCVWAEIIKIMYTHVNPSFSM